MDFSHISEVDVEEGIRQEAEQRARERDEMRGMDAEDIFTPSPDEPGCKAAGDRLRTARLQAPGLQSESAVLLRFDMQKT